MLDTILAKLRLLDPASVAAIEVIAEERLRQIEREGYSPAHDQQHTPQELARAGIAYGVAFCGWPQDARSAWWPWAEPGFRPDPTKDLPRSGAMMVSAIARQVRPAS